MPCCNLSPVVIPSPEAERLSKHLKVLVCGHLILATLHFIGFIYFAIGITDLIFALVIYLACSMVYYIYVTIYIWFLVFNIFLCITNFGTFLQYHSQLHSKYKRIYVYTTVVFGIQLMFYCVAAFVSYRAYREFKALFLAAIVDNFDVQQPAGYQPPANNNANVQREQQVANAV
eukprot:TRINITY_DN9448_c0_g2_i1.p2 TRINITY_DN9448_c0_g2~~TRINITY_DN9448_c0_g2_i1.p2  ORF type:complete len:174 (-),score=37.26 TRINITY_DN9448_c0_g2_i1:183-704(-)